MIRALETVLNPPSPLYLLTVGIYSKGFRIEILRTTFPRPHPHLGFETVMPMEIGGLLSNQIKAWDNLHLHNT